MTHEPTLSQYEARAVADYIEEHYSFRIGKTSLWRLTPEKAADALVRKGLAIDAQEIRIAAKRI